MRPQERQARTPLTSARLAADKEAEPGEATAPDAQRPR
jgi:hypothetical protein